MSWDIYLVEPPEDIDGVVGIAPREVFWRNFTHNLNGAMREAWDGRDWNDFHGKRAEDALPSLRAAIDRLTAEPNAFRHYEPDNGWGDVGGLIRFLSKCADAMEAHPGATITVSG